MDENTVHLAPVLLEVRGGAVSVQVLAENNGIVALNPHSPFFYLGEVHEEKIEGARGHIKVWRWSSEGYTGDEKTKRGAIDAMLADAGYIATPLTATIPDLLGDWDGAA